MIRHRLLVWRRRSTSIFAGAIVPIGIIAAVTPLFLTQSVFAELVAPQAPQLTGENFNTHSGEDYAGINVGFRAESFRNVTAIAVSLYQDDTLLVTNSENEKLLALINTDNETHFSTPFIITPGTYTEEYWNLGSYAWAHDSRPTKARISISIADTTEPTTVEITGLSEATASLSSILPAPPDTTAPGVAIDTSSLVGATPTITGTVDGDATKVQISLDGGTTWVDASYTPDETTWFYAVSEPLSNGTYTVSVTATDAAGNTTEPPANAELVVNVPSDEGEGEDDESGGWGNGEDSTTPPGPQVLELTTVEETPAPSITLFNSSLPRERKPIITNDTPATRQDDARVQAISTTNTDRGNVEKEIITPTKSNFNWYWILLVLAILAAGYYGYRNWHLNKNNKL